MYFRHKFISFRISCLQVLLDITASFFLSINPKYFYFIPLSCFPDFSYFSLLHYNILKILLNFFYFFILILLQIQVQFFHLNPYFSKLLLHIVSKLTLPFLNAPIKYSIILLAFALAFTLKSISKALLKMIEKSIIYCFLIPIPRILFFLQVL